MNSLPNFGATGATGGAISCVVDGGGLPPLGGTLPRGASGDNKPGGPEPGGPLGGSAPGGPRGVFNNVLMAGGPIEPRGGMFCCGVPGAPLGENGPRGGGPRPGPAPGGPRGGPPCLFKFFILFN